MRGLAARSSACELAILARICGCRSAIPLVNPIERDAVGGELERLIGWDAHQAGFVGAPGGHVGA